MQVCWINKINSPCPLLSTFNLNLLQLWRCPLWIIPNCLLPAHRLRTLGQYGYRCRCSCGNISHYSMWALPYLTFGMGPLPSNRHHRSSGDCLEGKRENYKVCSVQYCVQQLCTVQRTHTWMDLTVLWNGFCLTGPISLSLDSFLYMYYCMHV